MTERLIIALGLGSSGHQTSPEPATPGLPGTFALTRPPPGPGGPGRPGESSGPGEPPAAVTSNQGKQALSQP